MSVFHGAQGKGAMKRHRDERYRRAVGRQLLLLDRGWYIRQPDPATGMPPGGRAAPAPVELFLRAGDTAETVDFRSYARRTRR